MAPYYKTKDLLKSQPFYSSEIKSLKRKNKKISNIELLYELPFFSNESKELANKEISDVLPFPPKRKKRSKRLTKHQILSNIPPFYDSIGISRREHAHKCHAEIYDVEIIDNKSSDDSLFLAKRTINDLFKDLLREKRGFKYNLYIIVTLKRWSNAINRFDIETAKIKTHAITVTNQRFNLNSASEELKHRLDIWTCVGSGWIIDKAKDINIDMSNCDPLAGSSYIPLPSESNNSTKGLINLKNNDNECFKWCHIRFINPQNKHSDRINKEDKEIAKTLDYRGIHFL